MAEPEYTPNELFRRARVRLYGTREALAEAANAHLSPGFLVTANDIGKIERGVVTFPRGPRRAAYRAALRATADVEIGLHDSRSTSVPQYDRAEDQDRAGSRSQEPDWEIESRRPKDGFGETREFGGPEDVAGDRLKPGPSLLKLSAGEVFEMLAHLQQQWHLLVRADNLFGPRHALSGVANQLRVMQELIDVDADGLHIPAVRLAAQYAESAAWLHEDAGNQREAHFWTNQAMEWAYSGGDQSMVSWTAYRRSQQLTAAGHAMQAINLTRAALREEDGLPGSMRGAIRVQQAIAFATRGEDTVAHHLLDDACGFVTDDAHGDARGGHGSFCTVGYIEAHRALCMVILRKPKDAIRHYDRAIPALPLVYRRDRAGALAGQAAAYANADEPEKAAAVAREALPIACKAGSQRIIRRISMVGLTLQRHKNLEEVGHFLHELGEVTA